MQSVKEVIVVEGRYDKNTLLQVVDAVVIETSGFGIFNDSQKQKLLRTMAEKRGLIILTDPDGAGFVIRNFIKSCIPAEQLKQAYVPDIPGKEKPVPILFLPLYTKFPAVSPLFRYAGSPCRS